MEDSADVIVAGGGVIGVCVAYYLGKLGYSVILVEKNQVGLGCSYGNAGLITPSHAVPLPAPGVIQQACRWLWHEDSPLLIRPRLDWRLFSWLLRFAANCRQELVNRAIPVLRDLSRASMRLYEELIAAEGLSFQYEHRGLLAAYGAGPGFEKGKREAELLAQHGFKMKILDGPQARELEPCLRESVVGGVYYEDDAHGDCYQFIVGIKERLIKLGVKIVTNTRAERIIPIRQESVRLLADGREFSAKHLVLAAGSWTPGLLKNLGVRIPLQPGKGYSVTVDRPLVSPKIPVMNAARKVVITPLGDRLRFAGTMEFAGLDLTLNEKRANAVLRSGLELIAECDCSHHVERWCGLRPCTPDGLPVVDRVAHYPQIYVATGHGMLGFTLGPITGKLIAEMIGGGQLSINTTPLRIFRCK